MRAIAIAVMAMVSGCHRACKDGTLFLSLTLSPQAQAADSFAVMVDPGEQQLTTTVARASNAPTGSLEIDFANGSYPKGKSAAVTVTALRSGDALAVGNGSTTFASSCATLSIDVGTPPPDLFGTPPPDLFGTPPSDMSCAPTAAAVYVDGALGTDDCVHGGTSGAGAFKSITYALAVAQGVIDVAAGTYAVPQEKYPLVLTGTQAIMCAGTTMTTLSGGGRFQAFDSQVVFTGTANRISNCYLLSPSNLAIDVASSGTGTGGHVIDNCLFDRASGNTGGSAVIDSGTGTDSHITVQNSTVRNGIYGFQWLTGPTIEMNNNTFSGVSKADILCPQGGATSNITGAGNTDNGGAPSCSNCVNCKFQ